MTTKTLSQFLGNHVGILLLGQKLSPDFHTDTYLYFEFSADIRHQFSNI